MTDLCFTDAPQIDELPECWTDEAIDLYLEDEQQRQQEEFSRTMEEIADLLFEDRFRWQDDMLIPVPA